MYLTTSDVLNQNLAARVPGRSLEPGRPSHASSGPPGARGSYAKTWDASDTRPQAPAARPQAGPARHPLHQVSHIDRTQETTLSTKDAYAASRGEACASRQIINCADRARRDAHSVLSFRCPAVRSTSGVTGGRMQRIQAHPPPPRPAPACSGGRTPCAPKRRPYAW